MGDKRAYSHLLWCLSVAIQRGNACSIATGYLPQHQSTTLIFSFSIILPIRIFFHYCKLCDIANRLLVFGSLQF